MKHTTRITPARVLAVDSRLDVATMTLGPTDELHANDIGVARLQVATPLAVDPYHTNRVTGSFVVIDEPTNATVAAAMVGQPPVDGGAHLDQGS